MVYAGCSKKFGAGSRECAITTAENEKELSMSKRDMALSPSFKTASASTEDGDGVGLKE